MEPTTVQTVFVTTPCEVEILDELHMYLVDYTQMLEKKLKALKKEVKANPASKLELKGQMSKLRKMRQRGYDVLDDLEYEFHTNGNEEPYDESE